jgi:tRNA(fMet)-specific endonuclease VapC
MLRLMLDTNTCIFTIKHKPAEVHEKFTHHHGEMCISTVTLMKLIYGAEKSADPARNLAVVRGFAARLDVLDYNQDAAAHTAQVRAELRKLGMPIGPYDGMIAGHARSRGLIVVTNNRREFMRVPGLRVEDWIPGPPPAPPTSG